MDRDDGTRDLWAGLFVNAAIVLVFAAFYLGS